MSSYLHTAQTVIWSMTKGASVVVGAVGILLYAFQGKLIYPSNIPAGSRQNVPKPDEFGMKDWEELTLKSPDGVRIKAFVIYAVTPDQSDTSAHSTEVKSQSQSQSQLQQSSSPLQVDTAPKTTSTSTSNISLKIRPTIILLHANAGNVGHRLPLAKIFTTKFQCHVVALSYRGYGHSEGHPTEKGILMDAQTVLDWTTSHVKLCQSKVIVYGQSIGGAVAIALACAKGNENRIHGLIVENTFANLPRLIPAVMPLLSPFKFLCHQTWRSDDRIKNAPSNLPCLFLSGEKDELIPTSHFKSLYDICPCHDKIWKSFRDGTHNDTCLQPGYFTCIGEWIRDHVAHVHLEKASKFGARADFWPPSRQDTFDPIKTKNEHQHLRAEGVETLSRI